jgi:hypothetical protein
MRLERVRLKNLPPNTLLRNQPEAAGTSFFLDSGLASREGQVGPAAKLFDQVLSGLNSLDFKWLARNKVILLAQRRRQYDLAFGRQRSLHIRKMLSYIAVVKFSCPSSWRHC